MEDSSDLVLQVKTKFFWVNGLVHTNISQEKKGTHLPKQEHLILILQLLTWEVIKMLMALEQQHSRQWQRDSVALNLLLSIKMAQKHMFLTLLFNKSVLSLGIKKLRLWQEMKTRKSKKEDLTTLRLLREQTMSFLEILKASLEISILSFRDRKKPGKPPLIPLTP